MHYYEIAILKQKLPLLTYHSKEAIKLHSVVKVELKGKIKRGVILKEVSKPDFETKEIKKTNLGYFANWQIDLAKFIATYYFSTLSQSLALFLPYTKDIKPKRLDGFKLPTLTKEQERAFKEIKSKDLSLLFGVTGSGKTEIYIHLIANALKEGKSALLLMPEIALTPQITKRVTNHFGDIVAIWHSKLTKKKREETLKKIQDGKVLVVIGARSSLFLPLANLGLIIVDEEHDDSYKASNNPRYNAKDLSIYLGKKFGIKVLLGSATPLVTSYKKFDIVRLKKPYIQTKKEFIFVSGEEINSQIISIINEHINRGEQTLIFVPTRANFKYLICNDCGKSHTCPYCSIGMSLHTKKRALICHYCNFTTKIPNECSFCKSPNLITKRVGTSEIKEIIEQNISLAKVEIFDRDHITTANKLEKAINRVNSGEVNVVVGTQMLSKGHDYANITLSVILGLDFLIAIGDYRAKERAIALMHQIAGRSGRAKDAKIVIQTSQSHFYKPYLNDFEDFLIEELKFREPLYPPFSYLARVLIQHRDYKRANEIFSEIMKVLKTKDIEIVGAGVAPIEKIANKWRFNILLRSQKRVNLLNALKDIPKVDGVEIDMDPVDFS